MSNPREVTVGEWTFVPARSEYYRDPVDRYTMGPGVTALLKAYLAMQAERDEVRARNDFTYCAYCGKSFPLDDDATQVGEHIKTCLKHPMRRVEWERDEARGMVFDVFNQACQVDFDRETQTGTYDDMALSAYEDAQAALIEWGTIKAEQCRRTI